MQKIGLSIWTCFLSISLSAQERSDIGFIISQDETVRMALEWRLPQKDQWRMKWGLTTGNASNYYPSFNSRIMNITDTTVVMREYRSHSQYFGLRFGGEYQIKSSLFSLGVDMNVDYQSRYRYNFNRTQYYGTSVNYHNTNPESLDQSRIRQHFLNPSVRFSIRMNVPLGDQFILSLAGAIRMTNPIYMGASQIDDPYDEFIGSPLFTLNSVLSSNIGIRYELGSGKKKGEREALSN